MTLKEQLYKFGNLDVPSAIIMQMTLETRKMNITKEGSEAMKKGDKAFKTVINELDQMYDDLDRHIAAKIREQEYERMANGH
jgi:hypothetical protein